MRYARFLLLLCLPAWLAAAQDSKPPSSEAQQGASSSRVLIVPVDGAIGPASADFIRRAIERAAESKAELIVLEMDTPGGLDTSMRQIIKDILASRVPVVAYVAPSGARAASAGTYILYASHVAAMAPATNLGAATPVQIGGPGAPDKPEEQPKKEPTDSKDKTEPAASEPKSAMERKQIQDAAAYIRGLAQMRGRNADWAERAVREAVSLSAEEALKINVIDVIANDVDALLKKLDGRKIQVLGEERALNTAQASTTRLEPDWRSKLLAVITNPSIAYILMLIGVYGLFFEFSSPGAVLPGVVGAIALILALFAFQLLPVNYAGLGLIILGLSLMIGEAFFPSFGTLGIGGVIAFVIGSVMLIDTEIPGFGIPLELVILVAAASALFMLFVIGAAIKARKRAVTTGREELLGSHGEVLEDFEHEGWARVRSENWRVRSGSPLRRGQKVKVVRMDGLVLDVVPDDTNSAMARGQT
ncbi:MAG TPA: nodulation protein NfeD [Burkholderiales bacterium]|nr:nodulation protein NfeD [Burkholderiales bacterium]